MKRDANRGFTMALRGTADARERAPSVCPRRGWLKPVAAFGLALLMTTTACEAYAMGKMCLFSAVKGVVLDHGAPVEGAVIERSYKWAWKDQSGSDSATTDMQGAFSLPAIWGRSLLGSILPHEPFVTQTILVKYKGKSYEAWLSDKRGYEENDELDGRPISLMCRLEAEPARHGKVFGICEPQ